MSCIFLRFQAKFGRSGIRCLLRNHCYWKLSVQSSFTNPVKQSYLSIFAKMLRPCHSLNSFIIIATLTFNAYYGHLNGHFIMIMICVHDVIFAGIHVGWTKIGQASPTITLLMVSICLNVCGYLWNQWL